MSMRRSNRERVPEDTARTAHKALRKGNVLTQMRDALGPVFDVEEFASLFSRTGQSAEAPGVLALVLVLQFREGLTDREAAEAVQTRIDWKYALGLPLTDPGFDFTVLSRFRDRLLAGSLEYELLETVLRRLEERGLLNTKTQRTDSTHVLAAVRELNRLECISETMRQALEVLATVDAQWLEEHGQLEWWERYFTPAPQRYGRQKGAKLEEHKETIGRDGMVLLQAIYDADSPDWLRHIPAIETLRRVWVQQFWIDEGQLRLRSKDMLPPAERLIQSPFDLEARYSCKRTTTWVGYKVHLTETCQSGGPHLITHVETTASTTPDVSMLEPIHDRLAADGRLPEEHLVDMGYIDADALASSQALGVDVIAPAPPDRTAQGCAQAGFAQADFAIDWAAQAVTCPTGRTSRSWTHSHSKEGTPVIQVRFATKDCRACPMRSLCVGKAQGSRALKLRRQASLESLQHARDRQKTEEFKASYKRRAGVEGTISQAANAKDLRHARYIGRTKLHLQAILTACAMNLERAFRWEIGHRHAKTRVSKLAPFATAA